jgi:hypothetical protein
MTLDGDVPRPPHHAAAERPAVGEAAARP